VRVLDCQILPEPFENELMCLVAPLVVLALWFPAAEIRGQVKVGVAKKHAVFNPAWAACAMSATR
jgi:hypothetical protein